MNTRNIILALSLAIGGLTANLAQAHVKIDTAEPKADSELSAAPKQIRLHFNETLEPAFSKITLFDAKSAAIKLPKTVIDKADIKTMSAQLPALRAGQYLVRWSTMSRDGHKVKGEYRFNVK
ncbi:copper homeostasis periplasmic binding protein CopC [Massilia sp. TWR1-2-2]|uniref:copper homeostasis periplasmic binding protein CopC n=1 Tax=Massilia sp. TWR1-2-2 TaxID=2804584 RepID=UPI003CFB86FB